MSKLDPVIPMSDKRLAIVYPGDKGAKVVQIQEDGSPKELLALTPAQLQQMADAEWLPESLSFDEGLAIILTWMSITGRGGV